MDRKLAFYALSGLVLVLGLSGCHRTRVRIEGVGVEFGRERREVHHYPHGGHGHYGYHGHHHEEVHVYEGGPCD